MKIKELADILRQPIGVFQTVSLYDRNKDTIIKSGSAEHILSKYGDVEVVRISTGESDDGIVLTVSDAFDADSINETSGEKKEAYTKRDVGRVLHRWRNFKGEGYEDTEIDREDDRNTREHTFVQIAQKTVHDRDGFTTDYTWYRRDDGLNVFAFGDSDLYSPEDGYYDWEEENDEAAQEWFDAYDGVDEEEERDYDDDVSDFSLTEEPDNLDTLGKEFDLSSIPSEKELDDRKMWKDGIRRSASYAIGWAKKARKYARDGSTNKAGTYLGVAKGDLEDAQAKVNELKKLAGQSLTDNEKEAIAEADKAIAAVKSAETSLRNATKRSQEGLPDDIIALCNDNGVELARMQKVFKYYTDAGWDLEKTSKFVKSLFDSGIINLFKELSK